jgi:hypothetical protein
LGYNLYISRRVFWADPEGPDICKAEWLAHVDIEPGMRLNAEARADLPGEDVLAFADPTLAVCSDYSGNKPEGGKMAWFHWFEGNLIVKNPDAEIIGKMVRVAQAMQAKGLGEDDERYREHGQVVPDDTSQDLAARRPWWKVW